MEAKYRRKRLLVVDDDPRFRAMVADVASEFWLELCEAASCASARERVAGERACSAAILDQRLVNGDGVDLYRFIAQRSPVTQVVFLTGYESAELRRRVEEVGPARVHDKNRCANPEFLRRLISQMGFSSLPPKGP